MSTRWARDKVKDTIVSAIDIFSNIYSGDRTWDSSPYSESKGREDTDGFQLRHNSAACDQQDEGVGDPHPNGSHAAQLHNDPQVCHDYKNQDLCNEGKVDDQDREDIASDSSGLSTEREIVSSYLAVDESINKGSTALAGPPHVVAAAEATKSLHVQRNITPTKLSTGLFRENADVECNLDGANKETEPSLTSLVTEAALPSTARTRGSGLTRTIQWVDNYYPQGGISNSSADFETESLGNSSMEAVAAGDKDTDEESNLDNQSQNEYAATTFEVQKLKDSLAALGAQFKTEQVHDGIKKTLFKHVSFTHSPQRERNNEVQLDEVSPSSIPLSGRSVAEQIENDGLLARQLFNELNETPDEDSPPPLPPRHWSPTPSRRRKLEDVVVHNAEELAGSWGVEDDSAPNNDDDSSGENLSKANNSQTSTSVNTPKTSSSSSSQAAGRRIVHTYQVPGGDMSVWEIHRTRAYQRVKSEPEKTVYPVTEGVESPGGEFGREASLGSNRHTKDNQSEVKGLEHSSEYPAEPDHEDYPSSSDIDNLDGAVAFDDTFPKLERVSASPTEYADNDPEVERGSASHVEYADYENEPVDKDKPTRIFTRRNAVAGSHGSLSRDWAGVPRWPDEEQDVFKGTWFTEPRPFSSMTLGARVLKNRRHDPSYGEAEAREDEKREFVEKFSPHRTRALGIHMDGAGVDDDTDYDYSHLQYLNRRFHRFFENNASTTPTNEMSARIRVPITHVAPVLHSEGAHSTGFEGSDTTANSKEGTEDGRRAIINRRRTITLSEDGRGWVHLP